MTKEKRMSEDTTTKYMMYVAIGICVLAGICIVIRPICDLAGILPVILISIWFFLIFLHLIFNRY